MNKTLILHREYIRMLLKTIFNSLFLITFILILAYVFKVNKLSCGCKKSNIFLKVWVIYIFLSMTVKLFLKTDMKLSMTILFCLLIIDVIGGFYLFKYIGDINSEQCKCATEDMRYINNFLYYWRYILLFIVLLNLIMFLYNPKYYK
jgi:hypothetical protein